MEPLKFDINGALADLAQFDAAAIASSQAMNDSFAESFAGIKELIQNSALLLSESFGAANERLIAGMQEFQAVGEETYMTLQDAFLLSLEMSVAAFEESATIITELLAMTTEEFLVNLEEITVATEEFTLLMTELFEMLFQSVTDSFSTSKEYMLAGTETLRTDFEETGLNIEESMLTAFDSIESSFTDMLAAMLSESTTTFSAITTRGQTSSNSIRQNFSDAFNQTLTNLKQLRDDVKPVLYEIKTEFSTTAAGAREAFITELDTINEKLKEFGENANDSCDRAKSAFERLNDKVRQVNTTFEDLKKIKEAIETLKTALIALKDTKIGKFFALRGAAIASALGKGKAATAMAALKSAKTFGVAAAPIAAGVVATAAAIGTALSRFAGGGFPIQGQMFLAREAGPELVGTIGNRTAVVNNNQIVESVSRGVYSAVRDAMSGQDGNQTLNVKVELDGKEIFINQLRHARSMGASLGLNPAFAR